MCMSAIQRRDIYTTIERYIPGCFAAAGEEEAGEDLDPYELMTAVDVLSKIPKDFFEKIVSGCSLMLGV